MSYRKNSLPQFDFLTLKKQKSIQRNTQGRPSQKDNEEERRSVDHTKWIMNQIIELNQRSIQAMKKEKYAEALAYCVNCQLTFERAAQIIKINNHQLIFSILWNRVCAEHRNGSLDRAVKYFRLVIQKESAFIDSEQNLKLLRLVDKISQSNIKKEAHSKYMKNSHGSIQKCLNGKLRLAKHLLAFSGMYAQNKQFIQSLTQARKCIKAFKELSQDCINYLRAQGLAQTCQAITMLKQICQVQLQPRLQQQNDILSQVRRQLSNFSKETQSRIGNKINHKQIKDMLQLKLCKIITPQPFSPADNLIEPKEDGLLSICYNITAHMLKTIYLSAAYYLASISMHDMNLSKTSNCTQLENQRIMGLSEVNHLYSLVVHCRFVPLETKYLEEVMSSYNHFWANNQRILSTNSYDWQEMKLSPQDFTTTTKQINNYTLDRDAVQFQSLMEDDTTTNTGRKEDVEIEQNKELKMVLEIPSIQSIDMCKLEEQFTNNCNGNGIVPVTHQKERIDKILNFNRKTMKKAKKKQVTCNSLFHNVISQKEISKDAKFENSKISKLKCLSQIKIWEQKSARKTCSHIKNQTMLSNRSVKKQIPTYCIGQTKKSKITLQEKQIKKDTVEQSQPRRTHSSGKRINSYAGKRNTSPAIQEDQHSYRKDKEKENQMKNQKALVTNEDQFYKNHYLYYCIDKEPERCDTKVKPRQVTSAKLLSKNKYHDAYFEGAKNELVNYKKDNIYSKK